MHRDVKSDNFLMGFGAKSSQVHMIDFGLAKRYMHNRVHIPFRDGKNLTGSPRYASINTHLGVEHARRDDIESLGYVLVYFLKGTLPWQGLPTMSKKSRNKRISEIKMAVPIEDLCAGLPAEFATYVHYARSLGFVDTPNYRYLRTLFRSLFQRQGYAFDYVYDWSERTMQPSSSS